MVLRGADERTDLTSFWNMMFRACALYFCWTSAVCWGVIVGQCKKGLVTVSDLNNAYWTLHATIAEIIAELRKANPGATKRVSGSLGGVPRFGSFKGSGFLRLRNSKFISWATASALAPGVILG